MVTQEPPVKGSAVTDDRGARSGGTKRCPSPDFLCEDAGALICAALGPLADWPLLPSYSTVPRVAFWKGHAKGICCLVRAARPYVGCRALHFQRGSRPLQRLLLVIAAHTLLWKLKGGGGGCLTFSERGMFVLGVRSNGPLLLCCCGPGKLFSDIIKNHKPWLLAHISWNSDVSMWLYIMKHNLPKKDHRLIEHTAL